MMRQIGWSESKARRRLIWVIFVYSVLTVGCLLPLLPLFWMLSTAFKSLSQIYEVPVRWFPNPPVSNIAELVEMVGDMGYGVLGLFRNSATITFLGLLGSLASCSVIAFAFARLRAPGRDLIFYLFLATMMIPDEVIMIPRYILFNWLGWLNTYKPLIVPAYFGSPFFIFLLRQFFRSIPMEIDDAAKLDGCGPLGIYWKIMMPLSKPALAAITIFFFMWSWNDFMGPLIYLNDPYKYTVQQALAVLESGGPHTIGISYNTLMLLSTLAILPCMFLFAIAQRYFIRGIVLTGIKR